MTNPADDATRRPDRLALGLRVHLSLWAGMGLVCAFQPPFLPTSPWLRRALACAMVAFVVALWRSRGTTRVAMWILNMGSVGLLACLLIELLAPAGPVELTRYPYPFRYHGLAPNRVVGEEDGYRLTSNDTGMRAPGPISRKRPGELRVLVLGGSAILGVGSDDANSPPALLEAKLREQLAARPRPGIEAVTVLNGGQAWYTSTHELVYFVSELALYEPDMLLVVDGYNDAHHALVWGYPPPTNAVVAASYSDIHWTLGLTTNRPTWGRALQSVASASFIYSRFGVPAHLIFGGDPRVQQTRIEVVARPDRALVVEPMRHRLVMNWTLFHRLATGLELPVRFALQPTIYPKRRSAEEEAWMAKQRYAPAMAGSWGELEGWVEKETERLGIPTFASDLYIRDDPARYFTDYCHLTAEGNERLARAMADQVVAALDANWPWTVRWDGVRYTAERGDPFFRPGTQPGSWR